MKVGVIGGGIMGGAIAQVISLAGIPVIIKEINETFLEKSLEQIRSQFNYRVKKGKMPAEELPERLALISGSTSYADLAEVDLVIEAVPENLELKKEVLTALEQVVAPDVPLCSNTSSLSISELASCISKSSRVIGLHFFNPAQIMRLVEIIPGLQTSGETVLRVSKFARDIKKEPVVVKECAGFLVNRILTPYLNEAYYLFSEGYEVNEIDRWAKDFGFPMGPLELSDLIGLDTLLAALRVMYRYYGPRFKPASLLELMVNSGCLGNKNNNGFYQDKTPNPLLRNLLDSNLAPDREAAIDRLVLPMLNEAVIALQEGISTGPEIDYALCAGTGFPESKGGPLRYADSVGLDLVLRKLEAHAASNLRFWPAYLLRKMVAAGFLGVKSKTGFYQY